MYEVFFELGEEDYPVLRIGEDFLSPKDLIENDIPVEVINTLEPDWNLLTERIKLKIKDDVIKERYTSNGLIKPEDILENVLERTDDGYRYMLQEHNLIRYIVEEYASKPK